MALGFAVVVFAAVGFAVLFLLLRLKQSRLNAMSKQMILTETKVAERPTLMRFVCENQHPAPGPQTINGTLRHGRDQLVWILVSKTNTKEVG